MSTYTVLPPSVKFQNDQLDEADKEMLSFEFPTFGVSPGPTPSPSTPSVMTPSSFDVSEVRYRMVVEGIT